jgi:RNA polymerase sigma-70 factor, ECF subfamily
VTAEKKTQPPGTAAPPTRLVRGSPPRTTIEPLPGIARDGGGTDEADPAREPMLRAQAGDTAGFRTLVEMFQDRVMRVMVSVLRCDRGVAEDLCQEVFLRVHKGLPSFDGGVRFVAWLHTITMNVAITEYRRQKAQKRDRRTLSLDQPLAGTDDLFASPAGREVDPAERAHHREFAARVREAVHELPEEFREAVVLRDLEDLSYEEIAYALDLPIGTVRSRIHRGRVILQHKLGGFLS